MQSFFLIIAVLFCIFQLSVAFLPHCNGVSLHRKISKSRSVFDLAPQQYSKTRRNFKNFDEMLTQLECPVLVDFYAPWCGPCVMMQPVLEDIAGRMENDIKVAKVDTDKSPRLGGRYQVEALPTLILFNKGQVIERFVGYMTADELELAVRKVNTQNHAHILFYPDSLV